MNDIKDSNQVETTQKGSEWVNKSIIQKLMQYWRWGCYMNAFILDNAMSFSFQMFDL